MSYYFVIVSPNDTPLFELTFGSSKGGGNGIAHFKNGETSRYMNQFVVHAALDVVEEVQWLSSNMWLKLIDHYAPTNSHISCFITGSNVRFMLLHQPTIPPTSGTGGRNTTISSTSIPQNPTSPQTEEAVRQFMTEVYELWVKTSMSPFYRVGDEIKSQIFRARVTAAGRKWLVTHGLVYDLDELDNIQSIILERARNVAVALAQSFRIVLRSHPLQNQI